MIVSLRFSEDKESQGVARMILEAERERAGYTKGESREVCELTRQLAAGPEWAVIGEGKERE